MDLVDGSRIAEDTCSLGPVVVSASRLLDATTLAYYQILATRLVSYRYKTIFVLQCVYIVRESIIVYPPFNRIAWDSPFFRLYTLLAVTRYTCCSAVS